MKKTIIKKKEQIKRSQKASPFFHNKKQEQTQLSIDLNNTTQVINDAGDEQTSMQKEQEQIEQAEQSVTKQKSKKKKLWNFLFFALNIVVVVGILTYQITQETITPIGDIKNFRLYFLPIILATFGIVMALDAYRTNIFLKQSGNRSRPFLCYKMCAIGRYYDNITPMSSGGEPSQIFYMNHRGLNASSALSVPMGRYVVSQISWMLVGIFAVVMIAFSGVMDVSLVIVIGLVAFAANLLLLSVCLILSMSKKIGNKLVIKILKFLKKLKIIKHYEKQYEKVNGVVKNYQNTMQTYAKNKWKFLYTIFISIIVFLLIYSVPYFTYLLFGGTDYSVWLKMFVFAVMIDLASSIIPIPGGSGLNEISFTAIFGSIFPEGTVFWGLLIWRFMTYYSFVVQGICIIIYDYFVGNRKFKWLQKKWELEAESLVFKEEQIKSYKKQKQKSYKQKKN